MVQASLSAKELTKKEVPLAVGEEEVVVVVCFQLQLKDSHPHKTQEEHLAKQVLWKQKA
ncbi:MAG: hypothetical protein ACRCUQ_00455 [Alphaproteobacteria bacterium]